MPGRHASPTVAAQTAKVQRPRTRILSSVTVLFVTLVAGVLFGVSAYSARSHGNPADLNMAGLVREQQGVVLELEETVEDMRASQEEVIAASSLETQANSASLRSELSGPGLTVTLDDSPADFALENSANVNAAVVHQQDVDAVMNALWRGGAEALSVQGVRVTFSTPVRCIGNVILVGARSYAPPYRISAIGDVDGMLEALDADPSVILYREDTVRYSLGWDVQVHDATVIPPASDLSPLKYAAVAERA